MAHYQAHSFLGIDHIAANNNLDVPILTSSAIWVNQPAAATEVMGASRMQLDLTFCTSARISAQVWLAATATSYLTLQASTDTGTTWSTLGATGTNPACTLFTASCNTSPWVLILTAFQRDVWVRCIGTGGDGAIDPRIGPVVINFK